MDGCTCQLRRDTAGILPALSVGRLDLPALDQLADQRLRTGDGHHCLAVQAPSCPLDTPSEINQGRSKNYVLTFIVRGDPGQVRQAHFYLSRVQFPTPRI